MQHSDTSPDESDFTIKDTLSYLKESGSEFVKAKAELAALEAKEAAQVGGKAAVNGAILLVFALFFYALFLVTIIGAGAKLLEGNLPAIEQHVGTWPIVSFALMLVHLLLVFVFLDKLKSAGKKALFTHTKAELEKDKLWLQQMKSNSKS